jgi:hypothetical protein
MVRNVPTYPNYLLPLPNHELLAYFCVAGITVLEGLIGGPEGLYIF